MLWQQVHTVTGSLIAFSSFINLVPELHKSLFGLHPMRQSLLIDVVICLPQKQELPLSISLRILYFSWMVLVLSFLFNDSAIFWRWSVLGFFNAWISNIHALEFVGCKHLSVPLKQIFHAQGEWKISEWPHLLESRLSKVFFGKPRGHANSVPLNKSPRYPGSYLTGVYDILWWKAPEFTSKG